MGTPTPTQRRTYHLTLAPEHWRNQSNNNWLYQTCCTAHVHSGHAGGHLCNNQVQCQLEQGTSSSITNQTDTILVGELSLEGKPLYSRNQQCPIPARSHWNGDCEPTGTPSTMTWRQQSQPWQVVLGKTAQ